VIAIVGMLVALTGCSRRDRELFEHTKTMRSLTATTTAIGEGWLAGSLSGTYTQTALERTFQLLEEDRRTLATSPRQRIDPRAEKIAQTGENLSRILVRLAEAVGSADAAAVRDRLADARQLVVND
jgi:hypothetical protein